MAQVYREIAHPKLKNLEKAGFVIFLYSMLFTSLVSFFAVMIIPDAERAKYLDNLIGGLTHVPGGAASPLRLLFHGFVVLVGNADSGRRHQHIHHRLERRAQPGCRRRRIARLVSPPSPQIRDHAPPDQPGRRFCRSPPS